MSPATVHAMSRVTWRFRNVTKDYNFWPRLDSISIIDNAPEEQGTLSCEVEDPDETIDFDEQDEVRAFITPEGEAEVRIFGGHVKTLTLRDHGRSGPRIWAVECSDYTELLSHDVVKSGGNFPQESADDRLVRIMGYTTSGITVAFSDLPDEDVESADSLGRSVTELLDDMAQELSLSYYVDPEKNLYIFRTQTVVAPFALSAGNSDLSDSFPIWEHEHAIDTTELATKALVIGEKEYGLVTDTAGVAAYGTIETTVEDDGIQSDTQLARAGAKALRDMAVPNIRGTATLGRYGLRGGMTVEVDHHLWPQVAAGSPYIISNVETAAIDPHDDEGLAYIRITIEYVDKLRRLSRKRKRGTGETDEEEGDAIDVELKQAFFQTDDYAEFIEDKNYHDPAVKYAGAWIYHNIPHPSTPCGIGLGGWSGAARYEAYYECDTSSPPDNAVGIRLTIPAAMDTDGVGATADYVYGATKTAPADPYVEQYTEIGGVDWVTDGAVLNIPLSLCNLSGITYVAIAPGWVTDIGAFFCAAQLVSGASGPVVGGEGNSGRAQADETATAVWRVVSGRHGMSSWTPVIGDVDGDNRIFSLEGWTGAGVPQIKVNGLVLDGSEYTYDRATKSVTLDVAPDEDDVVSARYMLSV